MRALAIARVHRVAAVAPVAIVGLVMALPP